jgi:hypothetical protein
MDRRENCGQKKMAEKDSTLSVKMEITLHIQWILHE